MKKRDEIEEEILDEDEILEDEEVLDDEDEILDDEDVIDDDDDFEDERPAKKGKAVKKPAAGKGGKKKLSKGAVAGISIGSVVAFLAIAVVLVVFVILPMMGAKIENAEYQGLIGNTKPTGVTAVKEVNKNMTALDMLNAALENYDNVDYAANICLVGGVQTKIKAIEVNQGVQSMKIREGKATDDNVKYFARSISYGFTNMAEEYYTNDLGKGPIYYRGLGAKGKVKADDNKNQIVTAWGDTESYKDLDEYIEKKATDFTKIWSYEVTQKTVTAESKTAKPTKSGDCYTFTITVDVTNPDAIEGYKKVMEYQLADNMGANGVTIDFKELSFDIGVWENGFIRYIGIKESYVMNLTLGRLNVNGIAINNSYMNEYSYDKTEKIPYEGKTLGYKEFFKLF